MGCDKTWHGLVRRLYGTRCRLGEVWDTIRRGARHFAFRKRLCLVLATSAV